MESAAIAALLKIINIPEISKSIFDYLNHRNDTNYKKLDVALKAYGFTVQQLLNAIDTQKFIDSYRNTKAIDASVLVARDSKEFSDEEKIRILNDIHKSEISQQNRGQIYNIINKIVIFSGIAFLLYCAAVFTVRIMQTQMDVNRKQSRFLNGIYALLLWPLNLFLPLPLDFLSPYLYTYNASKHINWPKLAKSKPTKRLSLRNN